MHQSERAVFDLRRGLPVVISATDGDRVAYPIEGHDLLPEGVKADFEGQAALVLGRPRLRALGLPDGQEARLPAAHEMADIRKHLATWTIGDGMPIDGAFGPPIPASQADRAALALMRRALLLPAALTGPTTPSVREKIRSGELLQVDAAEALQLDTSDATRVRMISEATVPLAEAPDSRFLLFRESDGLREHVAVVIGRRDDWVDPTPVRLHSSCLTGDLFGSLRCDCGEQLRNAVATIAELGGGVLLYLDQEGRGIGLANKLRAYALQDAGHDTVDADGLLGFREDERRYEAAARILTALNIDRCRLLTNNPSKIEGLAAQGVEVDAREPVYGRLTNENRRYLDAKARRSGHLLDEVLHAKP